MHTESVVDMVRLGNTHTQKKRKCRKSLVPAQLGVISSKTLMAHAGIHLQRRNSELLDKLKVSWEGCLPTESRLTWTSGMPAKQGVPPSFEEVTVCKRTIESTEGWNLKSTLGSNKGSLSLKYRVTGGTRKLSKCTCFSVSSGLALLKASGENIH